MGVTGGRGDAVGVPVEARLAELVELLVEAEVSGRQMKLADVVAATVVVVVGVVTYDTSSELAVGWGRDREATHRGLDYGFECTDYQ